jgi:hypothetical protein
MSKQPRLISLEQRWIDKTEIPEIHILDGPRSSADIPRFFWFYKDKVNIVFPVFHPNIVAQLKSAMVQKRTSRNRMIFAAFIPCKTYSHKKISNLLIFL